jgi:hypothetical protein
MTLLSLHYVFYCALLSPSRTINDFSLNPYNIMTLLSLIRCFIVPFPHPLGQKMTSLSTLMIIYETSLTHYLIYSDLLQIMTSLTIFWIIYETYETSLTKKVYYSAHLSLFRTNNVFSLNCFDNISNFSQSVCVYIALPSPITTNIVFSLDFLDYKRNFSHTLFVL